MAAIAKKLVMTERLIEQAFSRAKKDGCLLSGTYGNTTRAETRVTVPAVYLGIHIVKKRFVHNVGKCNKFGKYV